MIICLPSSLVHRRGAPFALLATLVPVVGFFSLLLRFLRRVCVLRVDGRGGSLVILVETAVVVDGRHGRRRLRGRRRRARRLSRRTSLPRRVLWKMWAIKSTSRIKSQSTERNKKIQLVLQGIFEVRFTCNSRLNCRSSASIVCIRSSTSWSEL